MKHSTKHIVGFSGGIDSQACALWVRNRFPREDVIQIMVGDLQRLLVYAKKGFSTPQPVPAEVMAAYEGLVAAGYTKRLLPGA